MTRTRLAGVDEAGRGPLAGPVVCAAVILNSRKPIPGLADSKAFSESARETLFPIIQGRALAWRVEFIEANDIDRLNIFWATMEGMRRAVGALAPTATTALIDGNHIPPGLPCPAQALVRGDTLVPAIMAASILAKVSRDRHMRRLHSRFPDYGFDRHKGYSTADHLARLAFFGPCAEHRKTFAPVRACMGVELPFETSHE
jgi:ribonuclease HII